MINKNLSYLLQNQNISYRSRKIIDLLVANYSEDVSLNFLSQNMGISRYNIIKNFKKDLGISPMKWLWIYRTALSAKFIEDYQQWNIKEIASSCGFGSIEHHCRCFRKVFQKSPTMYRKEYVINHVSVPNYNKNSGFDSLENFIKNIIKISDCNDKESKYLDTINKISYAIEQSIHKSEIKMNKHKNIDIN